MAGKMRKRKAHNLCFPGVEVLKEDLRTLQYAEIAQKHGVQLKTVSNWVVAHKLGGVSPFNRARKTIAHNDRYPGDDVLREWLLTQTYEQIGHRCGVTRNTVRDWVAARQLTGISRHGSTKRAANTAAVRRGDEEWTPWVNTMLTWAKRPLSSRRTNKEMRK